MAKEAVRGKRRFARGPMPGAKYWPGVIVILACFLTLIPIVSTTGWWPDFGFMALIAWRLQRPLAFPNWFVPAAGLFNDLIAGHILGFSVLTFSLAVLLISFIETRAAARDYITEWVYAALLIALTELIQWQVASLAGASSPIQTISAPILIGILTYPFISAFIHFLDAKRMRS